MNHPEPTRACSSVNRRDFIKLMALAAAATAVPSGLIRAAQKPMGPAAKAYMSLAGVARQATAAEILAAVREAAEAATDFSWLSRGDSVLFDFGRLREAIRETSENVGYIRGHS